MLIPAAQCTLILFTGPATHGLEVLLVQQKCCLRLQLCLGFFTENLAIFSLLNSEFDSFALYTSKRSWL
jgi:hypothetical protein